MATAIVPKSEIRKNDNISIEYGEVPAVEVDGKLGWGLPGGGVTYDETEARLWAGRLNREIRRIMKDPKQLLTAA